MPTISFTDIQGHWAETSILALADRAIVSGYPDGGFRPDAGITRAEFAALTYRAFPEATAVRSPLEFPDVPVTHWAFTVIRWAVERGFFSGYNDGTFQPSQSISRLQVLLVLVNAVRLTAVSNADELLQLYFTDAAEVAGWARGAIATAISGDLVVNYPHVRQLCPGVNATRSEVCAALCRALKIPNSVPPQYSTWFWSLIDLVAGTVSAPFATWNGSARLMRDIQNQLAQLGRLPTTEITGDYTSKTQQALTQFCEFYGLSSMKVGEFNALFAQALIHADATDVPLQAAKDRQRSYSYFLAQEAGFNAEKLAVLDRGIQGSPYANQIDTYPDRLSQKVDGTQLVSLGDRLPLTGTTTSVTFSPYPAVGVQPAISAGLEFLHSDIVSACVCIGSLVDGKVKARWLGRNALASMQLWSSTKFIPLLHVVSRANAVKPNAAIKDCLVRSPGSTSGYNWYKLAVDLVNYQTTLGSSNAIALMFKQFSTPAELENWVKRITGNSSLEFRGRYGEAPFISQPSLYYPPSDQTLLPAITTSYSGNNLLSTYDITRLITMLGWHHHLTADAQIPFAQWSSLEAVVRAMGQDTARYLDVAIERLGIASVIEAPVIISKLGFGWSDTRDRTELVYAALIRFIDTRPRRRGSPAIWRSLGMTLIAAKDLNDASEEARQLDARMATEVTELLRRIMTQEL